LPNQIPLPLYARIILSASNPGDLVCDPFGGSFGSGEVAIQHNRRFLGIDVSANYVKLGQQRLREVISIKE
jgi:adenine-specific DNA-methyltransferase